MALFHYNVIHPADQCILLCRRVERTLENCSGGDVTFSETELQEINQLIEKSAVKGARYPSQAKHLWA